MQYIIQKSMDVVIYAHTKHHAGLVNLSVTNTTDIDKLSW